MCAGGQNQVSRMSASLRKIPHLDHTSVRWLGRGATTGIFWTGKDLSRKLNEIVGAELACWDLTKCMHLCFGWFPGFCLIIFAFKGHTGYVAVLKLCDMQAAKSIFTRTYSHLLVHLEFSVPLDPVRHTSSSHDKIGNVVVWIEPKQKGYLSEPRPPITY